MRLGILCPGQGDQSPAMFRILDGQAEAQVVLDLAAGLLGWDPRTLAAESLVVNAVAQPTLCAVQLATWAALAPRLPEACVFAGYSVGELAAHGCAGALSPGDVIALAQRRAALMDAAGGGGQGLMAVRGLLRDLLEPVCAAHSCEIAIVNDVDRLVVGGAKEQLAELDAVLAAMGAKTTPLSIAVASHTSVMADAVAPFRQALTAVEWRRPAAAVLAGIDGSPVRDGAKAVDALARQLAHPVNWMDCMTGLEEMGCSALLELGPCNGLARMVRDRLPAIPVRSVSEFRSLDGVVDWVASARS